MEVTLAGMLMLVRVELVEENALSPMVVTVLGMVKSPILPAGY